jgi:hypothetical protein
MTPKQFDDRYQRGLALLNDPDYEFEPFRTTDMGWFVRKKSDRETYIVLMHSKDCDCWDYKRNKTYCKHVAAVEELLNQKNQLAQAETYLMEEANRE